MCDRTCRALSGAEAGCEGERVCEEGCFCPAGKYLSDSGECVTADLCTCLHDGQVYQPNDVYADHNSIWSVTAHIHKPCSGWWNLRRCYTFFCVFSFACVCSNCENGNMHCSSNEESTLLSDLFYDDDLAPSRGTTSLFYRSSIEFPCNSQSPCMEWTAD